MEGFSRLLSRAPVMSSPFLPRVPPLVLQSWNLCGTASSKQRLLLSLPFPVSPTPSTRTPCPSCQDAFSSFPPWVSSRVLPLAYPTSHPRILPPQWPLSSAAYSTKSSSSDFNPPPSSSIVEAASTSLESKAADVPGGYGEASSLQRRESQAPVLRQPPPRPALPPSFDEFMKPETTRRSFARFTWAFVIGLFLLYQLARIREVDSLVIKWGCEFMARFVDPELAHHLVIWAAKWRLLPEDLDRDHFFCSVAFPPRSGAGKTAEGGTSVGGLKFCNPIGLGAGFDKDAEAPLAFIRMGFGFVEVGSVTPEPQPGNPKPRIFRLREDDAVINRYGFNSEGCNVVEERLKKMAKERFKDPLSAYGIIGVNLGKNKTTTDACGDIARGVRQLAKYADFLVVNVSSPNTPGLRSLQSKKELTEIVKTVRTELAQLRQLSEANPENEDFQFHNRQKGLPPLFIKIAPDLSQEEKEAIASVVLANGVEGLIVTNTTVTRPDSLVSDKKTETGGLSGKPLKELSTQCVADMYRLTKGKAFIIASGGVFTGRDAMEKIEAGASLVEIYTSMIYGGPAVVREIKTDLFCLLYGKGYRSLQDAVGAAQKTSRGAHGARTKQQIRAS